METPNLPSSSLPPTSPTPSPEGSRTLADTLQAVGSEPIALASEVKAKQRAMLLAAARESFSGKAPEQQKSNAENSRSWRVWLALGGASMAIAAAMLILVVQPASFPSGTTVAVTRIENVNRLVVPSTHATDFFSVQAASAQSLSEGEGLVVTSRVPLTAEQVKATIQVTPSVPVEIVTLASNTFKVIPKGTVAAATSYRISLPTLVTESDGSQVTKEYTWSLQPQDRLQVASTLPADTSTGVPVTTGVEFNFNHSGLQVSSSTVVLEPKTKGRVEVHGQTVVFVPDQPLKPGVLYRATVSNVQTAAGLAFSATKSIRFETATDEAQNVERSKEVAFATEFSESVPGQEIRLGIFKGTNAEGKDVDVTGYALTLSEAQRLVTARAQVPLWSERASRTFTEYTEAVRQVAFQVHTNIQTIPEAQGFGTLVLPAVSSTGFYAIRLQAPGAPDRWAFVQVTRIASYVTADTKTVLIWTVNPTNGQPLGGVQVQSPEGTAQTTLQGTAQIPAPSFLASTDNGSEKTTNIELVTLTQGTDQALVVLSSAQTPYFFGRDRTALTNTWGYLFADRPLYQTNDQIQFSGMVQDRDTHQSPEDVHVRIMRSQAFIDVWTGNPKIYQDVTVTPDANGAFQGSFSWSAFAPGYYSLVLTRGDKTVVERSFEVRAFVKPAYTIDVMPAATRLYANETVPVVIQAHFFDGTPFPGARLRLRVSQAGQERETREILLDAQGFARLSITANPIKCSEPQVGSCNTVEALEFDVRPTEGEEGEIVGQAAAMIYAASIDLQATQRIEQSQAIISLQARDRNLTLADDQADKQLPHTGLQLQGLAVGYYYEAIPQGTYYDFIQKQVKTSYRYERRRDAQPISFQVVTDNEGRASYRFPMNPARDYYEVSLQGVDAKNRTVFAFVTVSKPWSDSVGGETDQSPRLVPPDTQANRELRIGESVALSYLHGSSLVDLSKGPGLLLFTAARGIRDVKVQSSPTVPVTFDAAYVPNAEVHAVTFLNGHFEMAQATLLYKKSDKQLSVQVTPTTPHVRPGDPITATVHVDGPDGSPLANTSVAIAAVDQALYALTGPQTEDPLNMLYELVPTGLRLSIASHRDSYDGFAAGGAEMGGMGLQDRAQTPRRNFKDTATFQVLTLDGQGNAAISFQAPDNITSWHLTAVAYNSDLAAGVGTADVSVGQQAFAEVVLPPRVLAQDAPMMSVRAFGATLTPSSTVAFTVDAPTLGIQGVMATGSAFVPVYFSLTKLVPGTHRVTVTVQTPAGTDVLERTLRIVSSNFMKRELTILDAAPGVGLPPIGQPETELVIASAGRAALLPDVQLLAGLEGARVDTKVVRRLAQKILTDVYKEPVETMDEDLLSYQDTDGDGGMKLLPYGSSDTVLTAQMAMTAPEFFDASSLQSKLMMVLANASSTRDEQVAALAGLAALHQPVISDLKTISLRTDLTVQQKLWIAKGLWKAGDQMAADALVDQLLTQTVTVDGQTHLVASTMDQQIMLTAELAALTADLGRTQTDTLYAYVTSMWSQEAYPVLAKIQYLQARIRTLPIQDGELRWSLNGKEERLDLQKEPVKVLTLTANEVAQFRITSVTGMAKLLVRREEPGRPVVTPELQLARSYTFSTSTQALRAGDAVTVTLTPRWQTMAREGCYAVRDHLPGGWQPILTARTYQDRYYTGDFEPTTGEISFVVCKQANPVTIRYSARVVAPGSYTAEAPVLEHLEYPSLTTLGSDEKVTVKE